MDELIAALKKRADPEGVKEIPIRKIGGNRIEIILPQASNEEVEEVKKMLTDVGSLEFRILANRKHDKRCDSASARAGRPGQAAAAVTNGRAWARSRPGPTPRFDQRHPSPTSSRTWKKDLYAGTDVYLTGKDSAGSETTEAVKVRRNTTNTLILDKPHGLKSIASYRIEYNPSRMHGGDPNNLGPNDVIIREEKVAPGRTETWILCNLDRPGQEVTGKYLKQVTARRGRRAPTGRPVRVRCARSVAVRQAHPRASPRGRGRVPVSTGDPARQPRDVGPRDQVRDPRLGDHRRRAAGLQGQGSRAPDPGAAGRQPAGEPQSRPRSRKRKSARPWAKTRSPRASSRSGSRCWSCRSSWSSTTASPASSRSSPCSST